MSECQGEKRARIEAMLARGWSDMQIAAAVPCSRTWVIGVRKELGLERVSERDRIEQGIARGEDDATIATSTGATVERVAEVRVAMGAIEQVKREKRRGTSRGAQRYAEARRLGLCGRCGKPNPGPSARCPACLEANRKADRERNARLVAERRCVDCRADLSLFAGEWPHVRCFDCHERNREATDRYHGSPRGVQRRRERMAALYQRRRAAKLCARCAAPSPDRSLCDECQPRVKAAQIAYLDRKEAHRAA